MVRTAFTSASIRDGRADPDVGEAKCYASVTDAIAEAVESVAENLKHDKMSHELFLIEEHGDLSAFCEAGQKAIMSFLDPSTRITTNGSTDRSS